MRRSITLSGSLLLAALVTALVTACSSSDAADGKPDQTMTGATLGAVSLIDAAGFHGMDTALAKPDGKIDAQWLGKTRSARIAVASVSWPKELTPQAEGFVKAAAALQAALEKDDAVAAAPAAHDVHETQHDLSKDAYNYLAGKVGIPTPTATEAGH